MLVSPPQNIDDNLPYPSNICSSSSADKVLSEDNKNITFVVNTDCFVQGTSDNTLLSTIYSRLSGAVPIGSLWGEQCYNR